MRIFFSLEPNPVENRRTRALHGNATLDEGGRMFMQKLCYFPVGRMRLWVLRTLVSAFSIWGGGWCSFVGRLCYSSRMRVENTWCGIGPAFLVA